MRPPVGPFGGGRVLVVGMGRSGVHASLAAARLLPRMEIVLADSQAVQLTEQALGRLAGAGVAIEPGRQDEGLLDGCGLVIKSPGVPAETPLLDAARARDIPVWGEVEFAWRLLPNPMVGVTGTNGKTTTTELIGHILRSAGVDCRVAGNVGTALSSLIGEVEAHEVLVVELSSFQLQDSLLLRPDIAVLLNLSEDHLDRHPGAAHYYAAKKRIFANQEAGDLAVINLDDPECREAAPGNADKVWFSRSPDSQMVRAGEAPEAGPESVRPLVFAAGGVIRARLDPLRRMAGSLRERLVRGGGRNETAGGEISSKQPERREPGSPAGMAGEGNNGTEVIPWVDAALRGEHNLENSLAATAVCLGLGLTPGQVAAGLRGFPGVRHRLQQVRTVNGVTYVNDSKATNVDAAIKALTAFEGGIHLILGGSLKGCSFDRLARQASGEKVKEVILIGQAAQKMAESFAGAGREVTLASGLEQALKIASSRAVAADVVLLSPACASFDQYENYEQRGEHFIYLVNRI